MARVACPPAAGPLEDYAALFDELFSRLAQRRGFREYLTGLLAPRDRNKTLTGLAGTEPVVGAQHAAVQRLQYFLSESTWDSVKVNDRRLELLLSDPATAPHSGGVLVIDDSGDRKDGSATAHVGRQWLGRYGKTDNGVVTVTTVWADERVYYPLHAEPYTPASHFPKGRNDSGFRTKLQIAADLVTKAQEAGVVCRAVVADCFYGDHDDLRAELRQGGWGFVMALKPSRGTWQYQAEAYTPKDAARAVGWNGPDDPGGWSRVQRVFRDGHTETWWAADLTEVVRLYGIRHWIEQSYKQVKDELGWADFQVRSATAIHRHQTLVNCAFSFCWNTWFDQPSTRDSRNAPPPGSSADDPGEGGHPTSPADTTFLLAQGPTHRPVLADPLATATALVESMVRQAPAR
ncbi:IS701 family transposase [Kibdelosporangium banguiense]|uniref:IS701 family transposase n=1 Tax=Kibdelosporangium banguiense TaxID=1365924 RepID=UPI003FD78967